MILVRRTAPVLCLAALFTSLLLLFRYTSLASSSWRRVAPKVGLGDLLDDGYLHVSNTSTVYLEDHSSHFISTLSAQFQPGVVKPVGSSYSRALVLATTTDADLEWLDKWPVGPIKRYIYVANNASASLHPPMNKGNEAMIYFTHIINNFEALEDVTIFMHAHQYAWHNNDLLNNDASEMIKRLSAERVTREGYMNMRCHWHPGCPAWLKPGKVEVDGEKLEQQYVAVSWAQLFPETPIPQILAQPCCSQIALSRDRIHAVGLEKFKSYRKWLMTTKLADSMSGRIWEYMWQVVFTGGNSFCPSERTCYCDGFGVCFKTDDEFKDWFAMRSEREEAEDELNEWHDRAAEVEKWRVDGNLNGAEGAEFEVPAVGRAQELSDKIKDLNEELEARRRHALELGKDPRIRAESAGRAWTDGDGF